MTMFESKEYKNQVKKEDAELAEKITNILKLFGKITDFKPPMFFMGYSWELICDFKLNNFIVFWIWLSNRQLEIKAVRTCIKPNRSHINNRMSSEYVCKLSRFSIGIGVKHLQETLKGFLCCVFGSSIVDTIHKRTGERI